MTTHVIHYITSIKDISKLITRRGCILDILVLVGDSVIFIHIDKHVHIREVKMKNLNHFYSLAFWKKMIARYRLVEQNVGKTEKIMLISGHGSGWFLHGSASNYSNYSNFSNKQIVHINDIRQALEINNVVLDIMCFDCCFGAGAEIIYELRGRTKYLIGSQEYMYWEGLCGSKICEVTSELWQKSRNIAADFISRTSSQKESASITVVDMEKFVPLLVTYLPKLGKEDFRREHIVDMCEIWLKDCPSCDPRECNIFYDFYNTVKSYCEQRSQEEYDKFEAQYKEAIFFQRNEYVDKRLRIEGINLSPTYLDENLIKKDLYLRTYKLLQIYKDRQRWSS